MGKSELKKVQEKWEIHQPQIDQNEQICEEKKRGFNSNIDSGGKCLYI
jgi:hypothetical protein